MVLFAWFLADITCFTPDFETLPLEGCELWPPLVSLMSSCSTTLFLFWIGCIFGLFLCADWDYFIESIVWSVSYISFECSAGMLSSASVSPIEPLPSIFWESFGSKVFVLISVWMNFDGLLLVWSFARLSICYSGVLSLATGFFFFCSRFFFDFLVKVLLVILFWLLSFDLFLVKDIRLF